MGSNEASYSFLCVDLYYAPSANLSNNLLTCDKCVIKDWPKHLRKQIVCKTNWLYYLHTSTQWCMRSLSTNDLLEYGTAIFCWSDVSSEKMEDQTNSELVDGE